MTEMHEIRGGNHVDAIAGRLSLRPPQRRSLEILDQIMEIVPPRKGVDLAQALAAISHKFPGVSDFEREFPSLCFALATGVGKTRLMGAFIAYLHATHGVNNFFVLAPNLTIYSKLIADFTPNTPKYVLKGISEFVVAPPVIVTGENYARQIAGGESLFATTINIFNISKINSELRGGRSPRIRSFREEIGDSYFNHLARLDDLVLIMDESHRYRASAGIRAINELKPALGLELTATPFTEGKDGPVRFGNVVFDYPLAKAMEDGFVKEPAVVTRDNFSPVGKSREALQRIKLEDGIRLHESVKVELETFALQSGQPVVKPFMLVIARDTTHAAELMELFTTEFDGRYADKVIQVDSSVKEDEAIERLLKVEHADEPTEIVIHVNMLKEGWDVTNLYTIVPLRAANARTLIEQSIGRGLRLPYGKRTGVMVVDRLNIVAHDRFQEIVDEAKNPDSTIRLQQLVLSDGEQKTITIVSHPRLLWDLGIEPGERSESTAFDAGAGRTEFDPEERVVARIAYEVIRDFESRPTAVPGVESLRRPEIQRAVVEDIQNRYRVVRMSNAPPPDLAAVAAKATEIVIQRTIDIPRIVVVAKGELRSGFHPFTLDLSRLRFDVPSEMLWASHLRTGQIDRIGVGAGFADEQRLEDIVVAALVGFDDVAYEEHADLLYDLATQATLHFGSDLAEAEARKVLRLHGQEIASTIHDQMQRHFWLEAGTGRDVVVTRGFTALRSSAYTAIAGEPPLDFRLSPPDKSNMARYLFAGFSRCLYPLQKFQSDAERKLAIILERDALKWFKPARGQFQLHYRSGAEELEYQPDFVAEAETRVFMIEPKASNRIDDPDVVAKRDVAVEWCRRATDHAAGHGGKPWTYLLAPHDRIAENMTLEGLARDHSFP